MRAEELLDLLERDLIRKKEQPSGVNGALKDLEQSWQIQALRKELAGGAIL